MVTIRKFLSYFSNFCVIISFIFTKLLILGILFSKSDFITVNAAFVAKPLTLDILLSISGILALQFNFLTSPIFFFLNPIYLCHT